MTEEERAAALRAWGLLFATLRARAEQLQRQEGLGFMERILEEQRQAGPAPEPEPGAWRPPWLRKNGDDPEANTKQRDSP